MLLDFVDQCLGVVILPLAVPVLIIYFIIARARRKTTKS